MHIQTIFRQNSFSSRGSSASLSDHDDDFDAITPVEEEYCEKEPVEEQTESKNSVVPADIDDAHLWRRMLSLQRRFHCYNSARMSAALEDENVEAVVPPRACLDLMNDSIATAALCDEARDEVAQLLVLVPERSRSRAGSYDDIDLKAAMAARRAKEATKTESQSRSRRTSIETTSTTTPSVRSYRRRLLWRKRHDE